MGVTGVVSFLFNIIKGSQTFWKEKTKQNRQDKHKRYQINKMKNISETQDFKPISGKIHNNCLVIFNSPRVNMAKPFCRQNTSAAV